MNTMINLIHEIKQTNDELTKELNDTMQSKENLVKELDEFKIKCDFQKPQIQNLIENKILLLVYK